MAKIGKKETYNTSSSKELTTEELEREFVAAAKEVADATTAWKAADVRVATANWNLGTLGNKLRPKFKQGEWLPFLKNNKTPQRTVNRAMQVARLPLTTVVKWGVVQSEWVAGQFEKKAVIDGDRASAYAAKYDEFMVVKRALKVEQSPAKASTKGACKTSGTSSGFGGHNPE